MFDAAVPEFRHEAEVVVVGAGLSGLAAAVTLRRSGFEDVVVLEKSDRLGGTWRDNTYPGCGCDVPSLLYEYSFAPGPWKRTFATQPEILAYLRATTAETGTDRSVRYNVEVHGARWDRTSGRWLLATSAGGYAARVLVMATGPWNRPRYPELTGLADFPGTVFHSARWDHTADLSGRRIAVIGNAASTVQFLPALQRHAARVDIFQSTAPWVLPKPDYALPGGLRRLLLRRPAARRAARAAHAGTQEAIGFAMRHPRLLPPLEAMARQYRRRCVPDPVLRQALTPDHRLGARRMLTSDTYYQAVSQSNVHLHPTRATHIDGNDVVGADARRVGADIVVLATGFHIGELAIAPHLYGSNGRSLADTWRSGRDAYLGTSVSGYPNLFLLLGPNILSGTSAVPAVLEAQLRYLTDALTHLRAGNHTALDVRPEVADTYNHAVQEALKSTVYADDDSGYYFGTPGRNTFCWPWSTRRLRRRLHAFDPNSYDWQPSRPIIGRPRGEAAIGRPHGTAGGAAVPAPVQPTGLLPVPPGSSGHPR
ncbi:NAD(P)/FAD-dependent oxidoreductase [Kitasatospora sp. NBC_01250]|uniref:flavin-containing monooxygenase n=1 Tax=unclassified Kitasatospora TaxID=2633591 RepID=UPI002E0ED0D9|nr:MULTISPECIES: NAD(P)/FAD-dependent oxidoreductase [unclassified Kitasatospora]WSJ64763.1 NAD(P)/FAD-dependent oxidoreductase [Kitasatospora sp. NBC_01302]